MPRRAGLRVTTREGTPTLYVRGTIGGVSVFESTRTDDHKLAEEYRAKLSERLYREALHGPAPKKVPDKSFAEAVISYLEYESRSTNTKTAVRKLLLHFKDAKLTDINQTAVDAACRAVLRPNSSGATRLRQVVTPTRAILRHAAQRGMIATMPMLVTPNVAKVRRDSLTPQQALALVHGAAPDIRPMLVFALAAGARPAEYLDLEWRDVDLRGKRVRLPLKGGATRDCDLNPAALNALEALPYRDGALFRPKGKAHRYNDTGRSSGGQFATAWAGACRRGGLRGDCLCP